MFNLIICICYFLLPAGVDDEDEVVSEEEGSFKDAEEEPQNRSEDSDEILDGGGSDVAGLASNDTFVSFWVFDKE